MNMREAFEAWMKNENPFASLDKFKNGSYKDNTVFALWVGYKAGLAAQAQQPTIPHDFYTHQQAWRGALVIAEAYAKVHEPDVDDKAYWRHELRVFDRAFESLPPAPVSDNEQPEGGDNG